MLLVVYKQSCMTLIYLIGLGSEIVVSLCGWLKYFDQYTKGKVVNVNYFNFLYYRPINLVTQW